MRQHQREGCRRAGGDVVVVRHVNPLIISFMITISPDPPEGSARQSVLEWLTSRSWSKGSFGGRAEASAVLMCFWASLAKASAKGPLLPHAGSNKDLCPAQTASDKAPR